MTTYDLKRPRLSISPRLASRLASLELSAAFRPAGQAHRIRPALLRHNRHRWQRYAGESATLEGHDRTFDELADEKGTRLSHR